MIHTNNKIEYSFETKTVVPMLSQFSKLLDKQIQIISRMREKVLSRTDSIKHSGNIGVRASYLRTSNFSCDEIPIINFDGLWLIEFTYSGTGYISRY